jgi:hypothetical protein
VRKEGTIVMGQRARLVGRSFALCAAITSVTGSSLADDAKSGFEAGLRLGYGLPLGDVSEGEPLSDGISGHVPLWLDLGYRVTPQLFLGGYGQYGFGSLSGDLETTCDNLEDQAEASGGSGSCSIAVIRLGLQGHYRFTPERESSGWLGLGLGYEWMPITIEAEAQGSRAEATITASGFEFFNLQFGWDFDLAPQFRLGPFVTFSMAQFDSADATCSGGLTCPTPDFDNRAMHQWLFFGARGVFAP